LTKSSTLSVVLSATNKAVSSAKNLGVPVVFKEEGRSLVNLKTEWFLSGAGFRFGKACAKDLGGGHFLYGARENLSA